MADTTNPSSPIPKPEKLKPVTDTKIPGTEVPDISQAAETEKQKRWMSRVAVTTAIMAAMAAISSSFSTGHLNQAMFEEIREADEWNLYQAKGIKYAVLESRIEVMRAAGQSISKDDTEKLTRYEKEQVGIKDKAEKQKALAEDHLRRYAVIGRAVTATQIGIALAAIAILLRRNSFWALALAAGVVGAVFLALGLIG